MQGAEERATEAYDSIRRREERSKALLVVRDLCPDSWYFDFTLGAATADQSVFSYIKTIPIDQKLTAFMAIGLFSLVPRDIARIYIFQTRFVSDIFGPMNDLRWR